MSDIKAPSEDVARIEAGGGVVEVVRSMIPGHVILRADCVLRADEAEKVIEALRSMIDVFHCSLCGADRPEGLPCEEHPMMPVHRGSGAARRAKLAAAGLLDLGRTP